MPSDLAPIAGANADATRAQAVNQRVELARRKRELAAQRAQMERELESQKRDLEAAFAAKRAELEAAMKPIHDQMAKLAEVLWTVDLYLGRDETLRLLRDGQPAPADTPICVRQRVLVMAEESLVLMGSREDGMDAEDVPLFVDWLLKAPENLDRVLPEPKGVVVMIPTRVQSRSGNPYEDASRNQANARAYWLIRNGERLSMLTTDPELEMTDRVLPNRDEFTTMFDHRIFGPVEPGSREWLRIEREAEARQRHYMRILLVLQGLIDRTPVFHPLPEGDASFLRLQDRDSGRVRLIQDADPAALLTDGRPSFRQWQKRLMAQLRPGLRIVGDWNTRGFKTLYRKGDRWSRGYHPRLYPGGVNSLPEAGVPHLIEGRRDGGFVIRFTRTDEIWKRNVPVPDKPGYVYVGQTLAAPTQRASVVVMPDDDWVIPYDLAEVEDLEYYLGSRENRSDDFLNMVPTLRSALEAKKAESAAEAPFRSYLASQLVAAGAEATDAERDVEGLVRWWKLARAETRPLTGDGAHEARASREIVEEYTRRMGQGSDDERVLAAVKNTPYLLALVQDRQGVYKAVIAHMPAHDPGVFVDVSTIRKNGTLGRTERERTVAPRTVASWRIVWAAPRWEAWRVGVNADHYLTEAERAETAETLKTAAGGTPICVTEYWDPDRPSYREMACYSWVVDSAVGDQPVVPSRDPFGRRDSRQFISVAQCRIQKLRGSLTLKDISSRYGTKTKDHFGGYSVGSRMSGSRVDLPYWPDDETRYSDVRARLVWRDETVMEGVLDYAAKCREASKAAGEAAQKRRMEAERYATGLLNAVIARQNASAHARFVEDYGADAEDLWPAHLKALNLRPPIDLYEVTDVIENALDHDRSVVGETLGDLVDRLTYTPRKTMVIDGYEDIVCPPPAEKRENHR